MAAIAGILASIAYLFPGSPLHWAAAADQPTMVEAQLFIGFDPNKQVYPFWSSPPSHTVVGMDRLDF